MPVSQSRVVGSGFTTFRWNSKPIAYLEKINDTGQKAVAQVQAVHPLDERYPIEFALPNAMDAGALIFQVKELWDRPVWQHLAGLEGADNILDVWTVFNSMPGTVTCQTIIKPPQGNVWRVKTYHNVVITDIDESEVVEIGAMTMPRGISCAYTHATRATVTAG